MNNNNNNNKHNNKQINKYQQCNQIIFAYWIVTGFVFHSYIKSYSCFDKALYIDFSTYNAYLVIYYHQQSLIKTVKKKKNRVATYLLR